MTQGQKSNLYVLALIGVFFYISVTYNACSDVTFEQEQSLAQRLSTQSIMINNNDQYTRDKNVSLQLFNPFAQEMLISEASDCSTGSWEPYAENKAWTLSKDNDNVAVYVKYLVNGDESECSYDDIIHDDVPPELTYMNPQDTFINVNSLSVQFAVNDSGSGINAIECSLNPNANFRPCDTTVALNLLSEGSHSFYVKVSDKAGNVLDPQDFRWAVDMTKPVVVINKQPLKLDSSTTGTFEFTATDSISGIEKVLCKIDNADYKECPSPFSQSGLSESAHKFLVKAVDKAGNESDPMEYDWSIDATAPTVTITKYPLAISKEVNADFEFEGKDGAQAITDFMCKIDNGAYEPCTSPKSYANLSEGAHTFSVKGKDAAGNDSAPAMYSWVIDNTPPTVTFTQTPNAVTKAITANFQINAVDNESGIDKIECKLDANNYAPCNTVVSLNSLAKGSHTFMARAYDKAGNTSAPASYTWMIDLDAPVVEITSTPNPYTMETTANFEFKATDVGSGIDKFMCKVDGNNYADCTSPASYSGLAEGSHTFYVYAIDKAGNQSAPATYSWAIDNTAPVVNFIKYPTKVFEGDPATIFFTVTDSSGVESLACYLDAALTGNCQADTDLTIQNPTASKRSFRVVATDKAGNQGAGEISWDVTIATKDYSEEINITKNTKTDILFVMDTSGSMGQEMADVKARISSFVNNITTLDWQIAVATTDPRTNQFDSDGQLLDIEGGSGKVIYKDTPNASTLLGNTLEMRTNGSADERGINATYRVIERFEDSNAANDAHRLFLRNDAHMAVILVSDEDEASNGTSTSLKSQPEELVKKVKASFPNKNFLFNSIVWRPQDSSSACSTGYNKGVKYSELTALTDGILGSICASDYGAILKDMADKVVQLQKSIALKCDPIDANNDGQPDIAVMFRADANQAYAPYNDTFTLGGSKITFTNFLSDGDYKLDYTCKN